MDSIMSTIMATSLAGETLNKFLGQEAQLMRELKKTNPKGNTESEEDYNKRIEDMLDRKIRRCFMMAASDGAVKAINF